MGDVSINPWFLCNVSPGHWCTFVDSAVVSDLSTILPSCTAGAYQSCTLFLLQRSGNLPFQILYFSPT